MLSKLLSKIIPCNRDGSNKITVPITNFYDIDISVVDEQPLLVNKPQFNPEYLIPGELYRVTNIRSGWSATCILSEVTPFCIKVYYYCEGRNPNVTRFDLNIVEIAQGNYNVVPLKVI